MSVLLEAIISSERMATYKKAVGHDLERALALYAWNMKIGAAFLPLLGSIEICLRNLVVARFLAVYGPEWWRDAAYFAILGKTGKRIVKTAETQIARRRYDVDSGRMTAELTFGFWENMLLPKYQTPLWDPLHPSFPDLPGHIDQPTLFAKCAVVRDLRNRISHHEPIFQRDISKDHAECIELLHWLSDAKARFIKPHLTAMSLLRQKP